MDKQELLDKTYLKMALEWSKMSKAKRKKVGALIVKDGQIISDGYNGMPSGMVNTCEVKDENGELKTKWEVLHAESNAILKCAKHGNATEDATLYVTLSPCKNCSLLIIQSGIKRVVYNTKYRIEDGLEFLKKNGVSVKQYEL